MKRERDLRFDFFRGLALISIMVNHMELSSRCSVLSMALLNPIGLYDNAMTFVFISGFMYGFVYESIYLRHGLWMIWAKSLNRALQLYFFNLSLLPLVIAVAGIFSLYGDFSATIEQFNLHVFLNGDAYSYFEFLRFSSIPEYFNILILYIVILAFMPFFLYEINKSPYIAVGISGFLYAISWYLIEFGYGDVVPLAYGTLPPTSWQFLFFIGMILGLLKQKGLLSLPYKRSYLQIAIIWLLTVFVYEKILFRIHNNIYEISSLFSNHIPLSWKTNLGPIRILTFMLLVYVVSYFVKNNSVLLKNAAARSLTMCGQHSLEVFTFGVLITYTGTFLMKTLNGGYLLMILLDVMAVLLSVAFAYLLQWMKSKPWRSVPDQAI